MTPGLASDVLPAGPPNLFSVHPTDSLDLYFQLPRRVFLPSLADPLVDAKRRSLALEH
jgi:hypothetical protein